MPYRKANAIGKDLQEPKTREALRAKTPQSANLVASVLAAGILLAPGWATTASAQEYQQMTAGSEVYRTYCASCHGASARGDRWAAMNSWTADQSVDEEYLGAEP